LGAVESPCGDSLRRSVAFAPGFVAVQRVYRYW
jgi:hypothetical protein